MLRRLRIAASVNLATFLLGAALLALLRGEARRLRSPTFWARDVAIAGALALVGAYASLRLSGCA